MPIHKLNASFQSLLRPFAGRLAALGITAGRIALVATVVPVAIGALLARNPEPALFALVPVWMLVRMAFDTVNGLLVREYGQKAPLGGYPGALAGLVSDAALYLPFALVAPFSLPWIAAIVFLSALAEFSGVPGGGRSHEGPMGRNDRTLLFGALGALVAAFGTLPAWTWHIQPVACVLLAWTFANRVRAGLA